MVAGGRWRGRLAGKEEKTKAESRRGRARQQRKESGEDMRVKEREWR